MNTMEESLDTIVERQSYVEETYETVTELLELCRSLQRDWSSSSGAYYRNKEVHQTLMCSFTSLLTIERSMEAVFLEILKMNHIFWKLQSSQFPISLYLGSAMEIDGKQKPSKKSSTGASTVPEGIAMLVEKFEESELEKKFESGQTAFHVSLNRFQKAIERVSPPTVPRNTFESVEVPSSTMMSIISSYLMRTGRLEMAREFNANLTDSDLEPYRELCDLLSMLKARNISPIIDWLSTLPETVGRDAIFELTFQLRKLHYGNLIRAKSAIEAIEYARMHFTPYMQRYATEMGKLLGATAFLPSIEEPAYISIMGSHVLMKAEDLLAHLYCRAKALPTEAHLLTLVRASSFALPYLSKANILASSMSSKPSHSSAATPLLNAEIVLPKEFVFHSTFCCPVSKELSSSSNPPQLLPCGHVLSKDIITDMSRAISFRSRVPAAEVPHSFKCPYCPEKVQVSQVKTLTFD